LLAPADVLFQVGDTRARLYRVERGALSPRAPVPVAKFAPAEGHGDAGLDPRFGHELRVRPPRSSGHVADFPVSVATLYTLQACGR
jgi:hypothetical protein